MNFIVNSKSSDLYNTFLNNDNRLQNRYDKKKNILDNLDSNNNGHHFATIRICNEN